MQSRLAGLLFLLAFAVFQGVRDALFGNLFQSFSFWLIALLAFGLSTIAFTGLAMTRSRGALSLFLQRPGLFAWLNLTTAAAWLAPVTGSVSQATV